MSAHPLFTHQERVKVDSVLNEVCDERERQQAKFGRQTCPSAHPGLRTGAFAYDIATASAAKAITDLRARAGLLSWVDILLEELAEAVDEARIDDQAALRTELVQVAAVAVAWIEAIDRGDC